MVYQAFQYYVYPGYRVDSSYKLANNAHCYIVYDTNEKIITTALSLD